MITVDDLRFMDLAIEEAAAGLAEGGIPIGSALVCDGKVLGRGHNRRIQRGSVVLHGEMDALENAGRLPARVYRNSTIYTTLSPCAMCSGAMILYGIRRVVIAENTTFMGEEDLLRSRGMQVEAFSEADADQAARRAKCIAMMKQFIAANPRQWNEDIGV